jgi:hypothetical protein
MQYFYHGSLRKVLVEQPRGPSLSPRFGGVQFVCGRVAVQASDSDVYLLLHAVLNHLL